MERIREIEFGELTPARAMIAELVRRYAIMGVASTNLEVQKLAWFLTRALKVRAVDDPLRLKFTAHKFGPYSDNLRHLLNGLDGGFLHCGKRLADAGPLEPIYFEDSRREELRNYLASEPCVPYIAALEHTSAVVDGFESPLEMELLATVDWVVSQMGCPPTVPEVQQGLSDWPHPDAAQRKVRLFDERLIQIALEQLKQSRLPGWE